MSDHNTPWDGDRHQTYRGMAAPYQAPAPAARDHARYRLGSRLGHSGQMYEAQSNRYAGQLIVRLFPVAAGLAPAVAGFTADAAKVANLRHPHIAQVFHAGTFADGTPFLAMERLSGQTLEERIKGRGALPIFELLPVVRGIASALSAAHSVGIAHRELRADNVFIADLYGYELGFAKVLDFGVSRLTTAALAAGRIVAPSTLRALAPEQHQGAVEKADERSDQFTLAALTYRLLTGTEPQQDSGPAFARMQPLRASALLVRCAPAVEAVLGKALSKRPEHRFDSVAVFFRAIEEALASSPVVVTTPEPLRGGEVAGTGADTWRWDPEPGADHFDAPTVRMDISRLQMRPASATPEPTSVTEQFFVEGDRQEAALWENSALIEADASGRDTLTFDSFDRIPKRRAPLLFAALIAAAGLGIAAWSTGLWAPSDRLVPMAKRDPPAPEPAPAPAPTLAPSALPVASPSRAVALPDRGASPVVATSIPSPPIAPPEIPSPPARTPAPTPLPSAPSTKIGSNARPAADSSARSIPLRGYVWSPARRQLVEARLAPVPSDWVPPSGDSGPPPALMIPAPAPQSVNP